MMGELLTLAVVTVTLFGSPGLGGWDPLILFGPPAAVPCRNLCPCTVPANWRDPKVMVPRARGRAAAIFLGTVVAADTLARDSMWTGVESTSSRRVYVAAKIIRYRFAVERTWKGKVGGEMVVMSYDVNSSCGRAYRIGDLYLVYAERDRKASQGLMTYRCSRVQPEGDLKDDLQILGRGRAVKP